MIWIAAATGLLLSGGAEAQSYPARTGETGILDVPDSETAGAGGGQLATEFRFDHVPGQPNDVGPLPIYVVAGVSSAVDLGLTMREWGQPGDERPARLVFGAAAKLQLRAPADGWPGVALSGVFDRFNADGVVGARVAASTGGRPVRFAGFLGAEAGVDGLANAGVTAGIAASVAVSRRVEIAAEALSGPRGDNLGAALRWSASPTIGIAVGGNYFPVEEGFRLALTIAMSPAPKPRIRAEEPAGPVEQRPEEPPVAAAPHLDDRPRFRLRVPIRGPQQVGAPAHLQHGQPALRVAAAAKPPAARPVTPSLEDLAEAKVRDQEALAEARERRIRSTAERLDARAKAALGPQEQLEALEKELGVRERQLDARERHIAFRGPPTQQQRQLESLEKQLASQERSLAAQERSYGPALDAARGRERDAAAHEDAERREASRLAASASGAASRTAQLEVRKQAVAAKNRQLAALEARLVAKGEYADALEGQLRARSERVDAWSRRLDTRAERLDHLESLGSEPKAPVAPKPGGGATGAAPPRDRAAFVMVVKSPTASVKERPAAPGGAPAAPPALHAGVDVEKAVAAATVLTFPTPASQISELDGESLASIAKLAARESCELLIWARAKNPTLMAEAQRRAADIQARALAAAPLDPRQVVTRITTQPSAKGVDVVVSALRETAKPAGAPAAPGAPKLLPGESGTRQLREAVQAARGSIEACVGDLLEARRLPRAEGVLELWVGTTGRVTRVTASKGDVSGTQVEECLGAASRTWVFPASDGEYVVDVPITVMRGGAK